MIKKFKETGDLNYICKNKIDRACFTYDAPYAKSNDLAKQTASDKVLKDSLWNCVKSAVWWISKRISNYGV